jgi:hypothetical protein
MAFLRTKRIKGILYSYRVESVRQGGRVRQRVLEYLGRAQEKPAVKRKKPQRAAAGKKGAASRAAARAARNPAARTARKAAAKQARRFRAAAKKRISKKAKSRRARARQAGRKKRK